MKGTQCHDNSSAQKQEETQQTEKKGRLRSVIKGIKVTIIQVQKQEETDQKEEEEELKIVFREGRGNQS